METKVVLEDGTALGESIVKDIHALLMENILTGGVYRREEVVISGVNHTPPAGNEMYAQIKNFYVELSQNKGLNDIELAAWIHAEFVRIHPFLDGNGRTSRLLMNHQLMGKGFLPVYIAKEDRFEYYNALDKYASHGELNDFADMIVILEEKRLDTYLKQTAVQ